MNCYNQTYKDNITISIIPSIETSFHVKKIWRDLCIVRDIDVSGDEACLLSCVITLLTLYIHVNPQKSNIKYVLKFPMFVPKILSCHLDYLHTIKFILKMGGKS